MNYLKLYKNNPTQGGTDGTEISEGGTFTNPVTATLVTDDEQGASTVIRCAARCATGYQTDGETVLKLMTQNGTSYTDYTGTDYALSLDGENDWGTNLTISASIGATNVLFYVRLSAEAASAPVNDRSVKIYVTDVVKATA